MENNNILEYKNFYLFYKNFYQRLFDLIDLLIDHNNYNCHKVKNKVVDFLDSYSYYLIQRKEIAKDEKKKLSKDLLNDFKDFELFYESLNKYPTIKYLKVRAEFKRVGDLKKLSDPDYKLLLREYYSFLTDILIILNKFMAITCESGFIPNIASKKALKVIGYANYDFFFTQLEDLKLKISEITTSVSIVNSFKTRRSLYIMIVIFSPYFSRKDIYSKFEQELNFNFLDDDKIIRNIRKANNYKSLFQIPLTLQEDLENNLLGDLKKNISYIKRYISYEFGERDMSPKIKRKYGFVPYGIV